MQYLSATHAFDYIALRINSGLTSCKELATVMDISLHNNHSSCNASYVLPYTVDACLATKAMHGYTCYTYIHKVCIKSKQTSI